MGDVKPILVVTGFNREGALLANSNVRVIAGGGDAAGLARRLAKEAPHCAGIVSFGMAGALDPALRFGDWVIGQSLAGTWQGDCDPAWAATLAARIPGARLGTCFADGRLIADPEEKAAIGRNCGAIAVDMESQVAAKAAAEAGVPFAIMRCISDEVGTKVPDAILVSMQPDGGIAAGAVLRSVLKNPLQIPELISIALSFWRVYKSMKRGVACAGERMGAVPSLLVTPRDLSPLPGSGVA